MKLHFIGIGGSGISGVAYLASKFGYTVTGCDQEGSTAYGKDIQIGHSTTHIKGSDLVVTSPALFYKPEENDEIKEAKKEDKLVTWQEFLGKSLLKDKKVICVAGTHGKSTTTAMAGKLLKDAGFDPIVVVGANIAEWNGNSRFGRGEYAVIEADEFNNNFLNYDPEIIILNNIEFDHPDFFKSMAEVEKSFKEFIKRLKGQKILITEKDRTNKKFNLKIIGEHNQKNANMVYVLGKKLGIDEKIIIKSIESFMGIGRRMELIADRNGIRVYDDYAHHPTAIKTTLEGVRQKYPKSKILVIDEPHGYKRTKVLLDQYKGVFKAADKVIVGPIFKARDEVDVSVTPQKVANASGHKNAIGLNTFGEIFKNWKAEINKYDIVVIMGAGKSYLWAKEIAKSISVRFSDITTFGVGGQIKHYFEVKDVKEITEAVHFAKENKLPIFIIGEGSDILVSDKDFDGVVVKFTGKDIKIDGENITAEGGLNWDDMVQTAVNNNLWGLENLSGIPGTVGAAPIQNIGAYGCELSEVLISLSAYDISKEKVVTFSNKDTGFGYRNSIFKNKEYWQNYIIISITVKLSKEPIRRKIYESLNKYLVRENPTLEEIRQAVLSIRKDKLEDPKEVANAGSFFMNPIISEEKKNELESEYSDVSIFPFDNNYKIPAGWLIEKSGWKGKEYKNAGVSKKHSLILTNPKRKATAKEIYDLSEKIISDVYKKFGIMLEREVQLINF